MCAGDFGDVAQCGFNEKRDGDVMNIDVVLVTIALAGFWAFVVLVYRWW